jgi:hypothetical protein
LCLNAHIELETQIEAARIRTPVSPDLLQELSISLAKLTKALGDATGLIPGYDQKQYENVRLVSLWSDVSFIVSQQLKVLEQSIESLRSSVPKPKFSFKRKQPPVQPQISSIPLPHEAVTNLVQRPQPVPIASNSLVFSSRSNEYLTTAAPHNYIRNRVMCPFTTSITVLSISLALPRTKLQRYRPCMVVTSRTVFYICRLLKAAYSYMALNDVPLFWVVIRYADFNFPSDILSLNKFHSSECIRQRKLTCIYTSHLTQLSSIVKKYDSHDT